MFIIIQFGAETLGSGGGAIFITILKGKFQQTSISVLPGETFWLTSVTQGGFITGNSDHLSLRAGEYYSNSLNRSVDMNAEENIQNGTR